MTLPHPDQQVYFQRSFIHYLKRMILILEKYHAIYGDAFESLLQQRFADDMFPMGQQFSIAASFSMRACCWLRGVELVKFAQGPWTLEPLLRELKQSLTYIEALSSADFPDWENKQISLTIGQRETQLCGRDLVELYAIPNFFFHMSMGYAILRAQGVEIGKGDFDGLHIYAEGFRFTS